jgi:anti-anti-sigma factor
VPEVPLAVEFDDTAAVLAVSGDVDEESIETLRAAIEEHSAGYTTGLTVDLTGATYLPSVAVGVLVRAGQSFTATGAQFDLVAASGSLAQRVLTVSAMPHRTS